MIGHLYTLLFVPTGGATSAVTGGSVRKRRTVPYVPAEPVVTSTGWHGAAQVDVAAAAEAALHQRRQREEDALILVLGLA